MNLSESWFMEGYIDFEMQKYRLLAYLKEVHQQFNQTKLYPQLSDIISHYNNLVAFRDNKRSLKEQFPKRLDQVNLEKLELIYEKMLADDELMEELENITGFAIGDIAYMETPEWPKGHPQLANVAVNVGKHLATDLKRLGKGESMRPFKYKNPGTLATVGKRKAVVDLPAFSFQGFFAWLFWMFLHLMLILSVRNKLIIFFNWAISYFTNDTTLRLILLPTRKQIELAKEHHQFEEPPKEVTG